MGTYTLHVQPTEIRTSIVQYGITVNFNTGYPCGRTITGSWYVIGSSVIISSRSPATTGTGSSLRNGSAINPDPGTDEAWDGRLVNNFDEDQVIEFPVTLHPGDSLILSVSLADSGGYVDIAGNTLSTGQTYLKTAMVVTCLAEKPSRPIFRPPYLGTSKTLYYPHDVDLSVLPSLTLPSSKPTVASLIPIFTKPWIDNIADAGSAYVHPADNMSWYGREICGEVGTAGLLLCGNYTVNQKQQLAYGLIQVGIDLYHTALLNPHMWPSNGGHMIGRKFPILFAAKMLGMLSEWSANLSGVYFQEDQQTYWGTDVTPNETLWTGWGSEIKPYPDINSNNVLSRYGSLNDAFGNKWNCEGVNPSAWHLPPFPNNNDPTQYYPWDKQESYRRLVATVIPGQAMAARILGLRSAWGHQPFFDYVDRIMNEDDTTNIAAMNTQATANGWNALDGGTWTNPNSWGNALPFCWSQFIQDMYDDFRGSY